MTNHAKVLRRWWLAWSLLTLSFALHVIDEALNDFLSVYNPTVEKLQEYLPWMPLPTFTFSTWMTVLITAIVILLALSALALRGVRRMRPLSYIFAGVMLGNGLLHVGATIYEGRLMPGVLSSPLLLAAAIYLFRNIPKHGHVHTN